MARLHVKRRLAALLGDRRWRRLKAVRDKFFAEPRLRRQRMVDVTIGTVSMKAPSRHPVVRFPMEQPNRNLPVGFTAREVGRKYPDASFLDIGANIGDTAAMMASYASNALILVEPSTFYHQVLNDNVRALPNVRRIEFVFVSTDDAPLSGRLRHWGGTATFEPEGGRTVGVTKRLSEVADEDTRFVKMDTDGFDFAILRSSVEWLGDQQPLVLFESDVSTSQLHAQALEALDALIAAGYRWFVVWDDHGYHVTTTDDLGVVRDLHLWLHKCRTSSARSDSVSNFDILAATPKDTDIIHAVTGSYTATT